ncbi:unnamed protein product [Alternaria alternata]
MLSYSASCPCLIRSLVQLFEKTLLPTWVSHYAISIRDKLPGVGGLEIDQVERNYPSDDDLDDERPLLEHRDGLQFQLFRQGSLPFASIAYFETCQPRQDPRVRRDEKIVTATVKPEDVVQHIEHQDSIYKTQNVGASNCLLQIPRENSLPQASCQHFILELIRRIDVDDEGDVYEKLENVSQRPQTWCRSLLSIIGMRINDKKARVKKAYETLEDRWSIYDGTLPCPERPWWRSESGKEHFRKCFLDNVRREQADWQTDFGRLDFEDAVSLWELNHPRPIEIERLYEKR